MNSPEEATPNGQRLSERDPEWVSNLDLLAYLRCPYAWWHVDHGLVSIDEVMETSERNQTLSAEKLLGKVEALASPAPEVDLGEHFRGKMKMLGIPRLENPRLKIYGAPAGVDTNSGALAPIEVKPHKHVRRTDMLELAFQWLLLEPYRSRSARHRKGLLVLRRGGRPVPVEVELGDVYFDQVKALVEKIREARRNGVKARLCGCKLCSGPLRDRVGEQTRDGKDLTLLFEVGAGRAAAFEEVGIKDYEDMAHCNPERLSADLRAINTHISPVQLEQMQYHARAYIEGRAILFGSLPEIGDSFISLDLEYNSFRPHLWLIGLYFVRGDSFEFVPLWSDIRRIERNNMRRLGKILDKYPDLPVVTWAGTSADLPELKKTAARLELDDVLNGLEERHIDLFAYARKTLRLPIPELGLGEVAQFFGVAKTSHVSGGLEAQMLYESYRASRDSMERAELKYELLAYNRDDLEAVVETLRVLQGMQNENAPLLAKSITDAEAEAKAKAEAKAAARKKALAKELEAAARVQAAAQAKAKAEGPTYTQASLSDLEI